MATAITKCKLDWTTCRKWKRYVLLIEKGRCRLWLQNTGRPSRKL